MGDMKPSKMPGAKTITRKDDPNKVSMYAKGGLYDNINKRKRAGTSRPKSKSTVSPKVYAQMRKGIGAFSGS